MTNLRINSTLRVLKKEFRKHNPKKNPQKSFFLLDIGCAGYAHGNLMSVKLDNFIRSYGGVHWGCDKEYGQPVETFSINHRFEVVCMFEVLEHLENLGLALKNVKKHLKEDGVFFLSVPNINSLYHFFVSQSFFHLVSFDKRSLSSLLRKYFRDVRIVKINFNRTLFAICKN